MQHGLARLTSAICWAKPAALAASPSLSMRARSRSSACLKDFARAAYRACYHISQHNRVGKERGGGLTSKETTFSLRSSASFLLARKSRLWASAMATASTVLPCSRRSVGEQRVEGGAAAKEAVRAGKGGQF